jgi:signal transduction histidine kinase
MLLRKLVLRINDLFYVITIMKYFKRVLISIIDNGKVIDPEIMPRLFSKFATRSFDGTGLGLFIAKVL